MGQPDVELSKRKDGRYEVEVHGSTPRGGFGVWCAEVVFEPAEIRDVLARHSA